MDDIQVGVYYTHFSSCLSRFSVLRVALKATKL